MLPDFDPNKVFFFRCQNSLSLSHTWSGVDVVDLDGCVPGVDDVAEDGLQSCLAGSSGVRNSKILRALSRSYLLLVCVVSLVGIDVGSHVEYRRSLRHRHLRMGITRCIHPFSRLIV